MVERLLGALMVRSFAERPVPAARFELTVHVNVRQPDRHQKKNPNPRQPDARRDKIVTLTTAALAVLIEV